MTEIRGILFDKDGTLIDFAKSWEPLYRRGAMIAAAEDEVLARRLLTLGGADPDGRHIAPDSLLAAGTTREIAEAWAASGSPYDVATLTVLLDAEFQSGVVASMAPVTDLAALFGRLRARGFALGIASSDSERGIRMLTARCGLDPLLDFVAGWDSGHGAKPGPGMVWGFSAATGLPPAAIAVVGDNRHDMAMGAAAGVGLLVGVLTGTGTRHSFAGAAHHILPSIDEIETILAGA